MYKPREEKEYAWKGYNCTCGSMAFSRENLTQNISKSGAKIKQIVGQFSAILATESKLNYKNISDKYVGIGI